MTDYQPTEADKVLLDYAQTVQRIGREAANKLFRWRLKEGTDWQEGFAQSVSYICERKPRTVTLKYGEKEWELPVIRHIEHYGAAEPSLIIRLSCMQDTETYFEALREIAAGGDNG